MAASTTDSNRKYWTHCTGSALETVNKHSTHANIKFFGACFCPFVQRVWVVLEYLGVPYEYYEVDPYKKPKELLEVSPKGLVPGLKIFKQGDKEFNPPRALNESTVIMEYIVNIAQDSKTIRRKLFPSTPYSVALVRLQADHVTRTLVPAFYRYIQAQDTGSQIEGGKEFHAAIGKLVELFERYERESDDTESPPVGLWQDGGTLGWTDVMVGPWMFRAANVLKHYRGFEFPSGTKFHSWLQRLFEHPAFMSTCSTEELYVDSYERYAFNRPNTSQVADAINAARGLP